MKTEVYLKRSHTMVKKLARQLGMELSEFLAMQV